jgi:hypothetical protein
VAAAEREYIPEVQTELPQMAKQVAQIQAAVAAVAYTEVPT